MNTAKRVQTFYANGMEELDNQVNKFLSICYKKGWNVLSTNISFAQLTSQQILLCQVLYEVNV